MKRLFVTLALFSLAFCLAATYSEVVSLELPGQNSAAAREEGQLHLQIENVGEGSLRLSWNAIAGADSYLIFWADQPLDYDSPDWEQLPETTDLFFEFEPSQSHQFFYVKVVSSFVYVPGGTFTMGDTRGDNISTQELPIHSVTLNPFYIGKYHVTQSEYQAIMGSNPATGNGVGANYPVFKVSWYSAIKYCNLRSIAEGLTPVYRINGITHPAYWGDVPTSSDVTWNAATCDWNADGYRLPTEAEWEYAARGATNDPDYRYSGSDNISDVAWYNNNPLQCPYPVGLKAPNGLGIYDMSGNLWEWCWDWFGSAYYSISPLSNPTGPTNGTSRVRRGGSWQNLAHFSRVAYRFQNNPSSSGAIIGFRVCRTGL